MRRRTQFSHFNLNFIERASPIYNRVAPSPVARRSRWPEWRPIRRYPEHKRLLQSTVLKPSADWKGMFESGAKFERNIPTRTCQNKRPVLANPLHDSGTSSPLSKIKWTTAGSSISRRTSKDAPLNWFKILEIPEQSQAVRCIRWAKGVVILRNSVI